MAVYPRIKLISRYRAFTGIVSPGAHVEEKLDETYPLKSYLKGPSSTLADGPTVGGNRRRTGAV